MKLFPTTLALLTLAVTLGVYTAEKPTEAQSSAEWQTAAGGKMSFDVASVKQDTAGPSSVPSYSNFPLGPGDAYGPNGGLFKATNMRAFTYITFAYKVSINEMPALVKQVPKWVMTDRFDIEAHASSNDPTKDQMRLMMQVVLADRFKLVVHRETRQGPVFDLVVDKPGKLGSNIRVHPADGPACVPWIPLPPGTTEPTLNDGYPAVCGGIGTMFVSGRVEAHARDVTIGLVANTLGPMGDLDRPMVDKTGLTGTYDFILQWAPELSADSTFQVDSTGPTFLEALKEQLGLKLISQTGPVNVLVVDHIEEPSEN